VGILEAAAIFAAGIVAGTMNTIVGSGTLVTFPTLLGFGYDPVVANVSNTVGLVPGSVAGAIGYRAELQGQRSRTIRLACASALGGVTGAVLLLVLPASAFDAIVPVFIGVSLLLVVVQPRVARWAAARRDEAPVHVGPLGLVAIYLTGIYGGYFGAAQGIIIMAVLGVALHETLQRMNAVKNILAGLTNLVAALIFVAVADIAWGPAVLIAAGATAGGVVGARVGRQLPAWGLRAVIVGVGLFAIVRLVAV
jgi:uncharacterized membrane protein YfcA